LPEFGNDDISHNVEYSLHPSRPLAKIKFNSVELPITSKKIANHKELYGLIAEEKLTKSHSLLNKEFILRNSCTVCDTGDTFINAYLDAFANGKGQYSVATLQRRPFAIFECKRVGVEEGMRKGPQTIEKAKQGAYVARTVSALQKLRLTDGSMGGVYSEKRWFFPTRKLL